MSVRYSFCKQTIKAHPPSSPYITQKIRQILFSCKGENQGTRKPKEQQKTNEMRDSALLKAESQVFLI
jgi:hypothetical protein